jgi:hypothetical protein
MRIKRCAMARRVRLTSKARNEMWRGLLTEDDVLESLLNAQTIQKAMKSTSGLREEPGEMLYVIQSTNFRGTLIYTKGKLVVEYGIETFYVLLSAERSVSDGD